MHEKVVCLQEYITSLVDQTTPSAALDVLHHQHAEGGSGHSGKVFVTRWYVGHMTVGVWNSIKYHKYVPKIAHARGLILRSCMAQ